MLLGIEKIYLSEELFEDDKKPKNKDILKYVKENIPQEIGTIDGNNIEVKNRWSKPVKAADNRQ